MQTVLLFALALATSVPGPDAPPRPPANPPVAAHNLHVTYGRMAVEGGVAVLVVRFFRDDLEAALRRGGLPANVPVGATPAVERVFTAYLNRHLTVQADRRTLVGRVVGSGEDGEMWFYRVEYRAPAPIRALALRNRLLFDVYDDQKHLFKVSFFPSGQEESLYFIAGSDRFTVRRRS